MKKYFVVSLNIFSRHQNLSKHITFDVDEIFWKYFFKLMLTHSILMLRCLWLTLTHSRNNIPMLELWSLEEKFTKTFKWALLHFTLAYNLFTYQVPSFFTKVSMQTNCYSNSRCQWIATPQQHQWMKVFTFKRIWCQKKYTPNTIKKLWVALYIFNSQMIWIVGFFSTTCFPV